MDNKKLIKLWIEYLKGLKIVSLQSNPDGKLNYTRPVTLEDIVNFLEVKTDYSMEEIADAVRSVLLKSPTYDVPQDTELGNDSQTPKLPPKKPGNDLSTWMHYGMSPGQAKTTGKDVVPARPQRAAPQQDVIDAEPGNAQIGHDPNSVSDVEYKEKPADPKKKKKPFWKRMFEDIKDKKSPGVEEKDVEEIFRILTSGGAKVSDTEDKPEKQARSAGKPKAGQTEAPPEEQQAKKEEDMRKMKRLIRDVMTDSQRKALWRMLTDEQTQ